MGRRVRALLVGIDAYEPPVRPLHGCVADIEAIERLLRARTQATGDELVVKTLRDAEASRAGVIAAFREHLGAATEGETALFYYSGHGSQQACAPEHAALEPDRLDETLVLHDSRRPGSYDLADKELAQLVSEASAGGAHVAIVLDCCHSGSGVRALFDEAVAVRRAPTDRRVRDHGSYLAATGAAPDARAVSDWLNAPGARYVLLAACRSDQTAKEVAIDGRPRGALSASLERTLARTAGALSYQDMQAHVAAAVRNLADDQTPVLESPFGEDARQPFLGGAAAPATPRLTVAWEDGQGWILQAGLVHGIRAPVPSEPAAAVTLHELVPGGGASADAVAEASVAIVGPASSVLTVADETGLDTAAVYAAVVRSLPVTPLTLTVSGDADAVQRVRQAAAESQLLRPVDDDSGALRVEASKHGLRLASSAGGRDLVAEEGSVSDASVDRVVAAANHVARWRILADRTNPTTTLPPEAVDLRCLDEEGELVPEAGAVERWYTRAGATATQPVLRIRIRNGSQRRLYYAALALSELYGVSSLLPGGGVWLDASEEAWVPGADGRPFVYLSVPEGQERATDILKLVVTTEQFDAQALQQADLTPPTRTRSARVAERGISTRPEVPAGADWATTEVVVTTVRPAADQAVGEAAGRLAAGVTIEPHPTFRARARLVSRPTASRDALVSLVPPLLLDAPELAEPYAFVPTRAAGQELSVLELDDVEGAEAVTEEQPLVVAVDGPFDPAEHVLPIAFDGVDYLPVGTVRRTADGGEIVLTRLPSPREELTRSLGGALKILFRKVVLRRLGGDYSYPRLGVVTREDDGEVAYEHDPARVRATVAAANRLLLIVHGIIGDTRSIAGGAFRASLDDGFDTVLAFDYESINTPVSETARGLDQALRGAGLDEDDTKSVVVLAHSMGGLIARYAIERERMAGLVDGLVLCGTPSGGSPWPRVEDLATAATGLALNGLSGLAGPFAIAVKAFGFVVSAMEKLDVGLDDMKPGSQLLSQLAGSSQPEIRYVAVAGDEPFGPAGEPGAARRILRKLRAPEAALALFGGPHDLAVSVKSATMFGSGWDPVPSALDADCSHVTYFADEQAVEAVRRALADL